MADDDRTSTRLAQALESLSELSLDQLRAVLELPLDEENGPLLRAKTTAAAVALNTQLRADALRLRAQRDDKALDRLIAMMRAKEIGIPWRIAAAPDG